MSGLFVMCYSRANTVDEIDPFLLEVREVCPTAPILTNDLARLIRVKAKEAGWL